MPSMESKKYWFKRRRFGWGWTPVTWQGWLTVAFFIGLIIAASMQLPSKPEEPTPDQTLRFWVLFVSATAGILVVSALKGPKPKWRWGKTPTDNPEEDI